MNEWCDTTDFGTVTKSGHTVALTQNAYVTNNGCNGSAIYEAGAIDSNGDAYKVQWRIINPDNFAELDDESNACDWDNPSCIKAL